MAANYYKKAKNYCKKGPWKLSKSKVCRWYWDGYKWIYHTLYACKYWSHLSITSLSELSLMKMFLISSIEKSVSEDMSVFNAKSDANVLLL